MEYGIMALLAITSSQQTQPTTTKTDYSNVLMVKPLFDLEMPEAKVEAEKPKELTLEEKIATNVNKCDESIEWIWAQDATCHPKPQNTTITTLDVQRGTFSNTYDLGHCTFYAKNRRPDLSNSLGNANTWVVRAAAQGYATGYTPKAGSVGQKGMHVVYVESVNADGTFNLSEMNYQTLGVITYRTVSSVGWSFVY